MLFVTNPAIKPMAWWSFSSVTNSLPTTVNWIYERTVGCPARIHPKNDLLNGYAESHVSKAFGTYGSVGGNGKYRSIDASNIPNPNCSVDSSNRLPREQECHGGRMLLMKRLFSVR